MCDCGRKNCNDVTVVKGSYKLYWSTASQNDNNESQRYLTKDEYEKELKRIQEEHLRQVQNFKDSFWRPCMHDQCPSCHGTGVKLNGERCIHMIYCNCPKCSPSFSLPNTPTTICEVK